MSDRKLVIRFIKDVESYPCLYDTKSVDYVNNDLKRRTWLQIAKKWNCSIAECRDKWKKLRTVYMRSLKPKYRNNQLVTSKPYYLAKYLHFIRPDRVPTAKNNEIGFIIKADVETDVSKDSEDNFNNQVEYPVEVIEEDGFNDNDKFSDDIDTSIESNNDIFSSEGNRCNEVKSQNGRDIISVNVDNNTKDASEIRFKNIHVPSFNFNIEGSTEKTKKIDVSNRIHQSCSNCNNIKSKSRQMLLMSILPDVETLSDQQMRTFRRGLIDLIDMCKSDDGA